MVNTVRDDRPVADLVAKARAGDQSAWGQIVERYAPLVWAMCRRHGLSGADVDDVGAAVWLKLVERLDTIREPAALAGWLATTSRRECLHLLRSRRKQVLVGDDEQIVDETDAGADEWLLKQERHVALRIAFADLPDRCRELLSMLFSDPPVPYVDISAAIGIAVGAIGPNRQRCLERLRRNGVLAALVDPPAAPVQKSATDGRTS